MQSYDVPGTMKVASRATEPIPWQQASNQDTSSVTSDFLYCSNWLLMFIIGVFHGLPFYLSNLLTLTSRVDEHLNNNLAIEKTLEQISFWKTWTKHGKSVRVSLDQKRNFQCSASGWNAPVPLAVQICQCPWHHLRKPNASIARFRVVVLILFESFWNAPLDKPWNTSIQYNWCLEVQTGYTGIHQLMWWDYGKDLFDMCPDFNTQHCIKTADGLDFSKHIVFQRSTCQGAALQSGVLVRLSKSLWAGQNTDTKHRVAFQSIKFTIPWLNNGRTRQCWDMNFHAPLCSGFGHIRQLILCHS